MLPRMASPRPPSGELTREQVCGTLASVLLETRGLTGTGTPPKLDGAGLQLGEGRGRSLTALNQIQACRLGQDTSSLIPPCETEAWLTPSS